MPHIYISPIDDKKHNLEVKDDNAKYIASILRHKKGDELTIFDDKGRFFKSIITDITKKSVLLDITQIEKPETESPAYLILCMSLLKGYKMDMVIQKTTELGVKEIVPLITQRSEVIYTRKMDRWRKIALEASRQSARAASPKIHDITKFNDIVSRIKINKEEEKALLFYEQNRLNGFNKNIGFSKASKMYVFIGPEGGFTSDEVEIAKDAGIYINSLGKRILRAETAAISALTIIQFLYGDMNV
ncbi:Ribosomal RNA small subunit methyltransferase E [Candidatus Magnetoovum chiemensis]|nr:Ribosomal RNA small subunit methyltransferase E [Candidatus Magnetoovum chiemensis]